MSTYKSDSTVLIASADCQTNSMKPGTGASLCNAQNTTYFPHIVFGPAGNLTAYNGPRDYATLKAFVESHAGPPKPSPPSPSPPSSQAHYERPPCRSDETELQVQGVSGVMCSPSCTNSACPSDLSVRVYAQPKCVLQDKSSGERYCALECSTDGDCDQAGGASCKSISDIGLCTYPQTETKTCPIMAAIDNVSKIVVV